jgi:class 3 adenylate cyclase
VAEHRVRIVAWTAFVTFPLAGLAILLAAPHADVRWENHPSHFWLVLGSSIASAILAYATGEVAARRGDGRLFLVSLGFLAAAGFLGLHALATPGVLLAKSNEGFTIATPVGLTVAAGFAAASSRELSAATAALVMRWAGPMRATLLAAIGAWAMLSLTGIGPLDDPTTPERASGRLLVLAAIGLVLYGVAMAGYLRVYRRIGSGLPIAVAAAFALLAEAMAAIAIGRNWHASWWEWHLLMVTAFAIVAVSAHRQWHEERFSGLYMPQTAGARREISVLFADLEQFTSFAEQNDAEDVAAMLNAYLAVAIPPIVERYGGEIDRLIGDGLMVVFNRRGDQPDHAERAARAALVIQDATARLARAHPEWPRFRVGVNTGDAAVGLLGAPGARTHTVIGDTVNLAARLEATAPAGGVAVGPETLRRLPTAHVRRLGSIVVKGRVQPIDAHILLGL